MTPSLLQSILLVLFVCTWLIGGNILIASHYKRLGKPRLSGFKPFAFPFSNFNVKEWLTLAALAITSLTLGAIAVSLGAA